MDWGNIRCAVDGCGADEKKGREHDARGLVVFDIRLISDLWPLITSIILPTRL
jgi:hypothetical protein